MVVVVVAVVGVVVAVVWVAGLRKIRSVVHLTLLTHIITVYWYDSCICCRYVYVLSPLYLFCCIKTQENLQKKHFESVKTIRRVSNTGARSSAGDEDENAKAEAEKDSVLCWRRPGFVAGFDSLVGQLYWVRLSW